MHGTSLAKPMLAFMLVPRAGGARFMALMNHREILSWGPISTRTVHGLWAYFSARTAFPEGADNPGDVPIRILASDGRMRFENVVFWYQVRTS